jgi:hypothetical protein
MGIAYRNGIYGSVKSPVPQGGPFVSAGDDAEPSNTTTIDR